MTTIFQRYELPIAYSMIAAAKRIRPRRDGHHSFEQYFLFWTAFNNIYTTIAHRKGLRTQIKKNDDGSMSDVQQSYINIKSRLDNVAQSIGTFPGVTQSARDELEQLITKLNKALQEVPSDRSGEAEKVSKRVETLIKDASTEKPDRERVEITGESLILAAKNLASVTPIVLTIATQIVQAVSRMLP